MGTILGLMVGPIAHYVKGHPSSYTFPSFCAPYLVSFIAAALGSSIPFVCIAAGVDASALRPSHVELVDVD
jgi:hypothetical protein